MDARKFLENYGRAWETRDAELAASLFAPQADYWETPFGKPLAGREAIRAYWQAATATQEEIHFAPGDFLIVGQTLVAEWRCTYRHRPSRSPAVAGERRELRGILLAEFRGELVSSFREYWHRRTL